jgi:hypothetical protein
MRAVDWGNATARLAYQRLAKNVQKVPALTARFFGSDSPHGTPCEKGMI